jgi:hypothetical protein
MRIVIETDPAPARQPEAAPTPAQAQADTPTDGGAAPGATGPAPGPDSEADGGTPPEDLIQAIAVAEAQGSADPAATTAGSDAGAGPSGL